MEFQVPELPCHHEVAELNRDVWCTKLMQIDADEWVNLREVAMWEKGVGWILRELAGDTMDMDFKIAAVTVPKTVIHAPGSTVQPKATIDLESMALSQGGYLMSNQKCKLPEGSFKRSHWQKGFEEIHDPTPKKHTGSEDELVPITKLPEWARAAFTVPKLNRVQSKLFPVAFGTDEPLLLCAPTGAQAGKTNVAMMTILNELAKYRDVALTNSTRPPPCLHNFALSRSLTSPIKITTSSQIINTAVSILTTWSSMSSSSPSSAGASPPDTPLTTPLFSHPANSFNHFGLSAKDAASPRSPVSAFEITIVLPTCSIHGHSIAAFPSSRNSLPNLSKNPDPFNVYAGYSNYSSSMPGTVPSPPASDNIQAPVSPTTKPTSPYGCLPPAVVFSTVNTPANSRVPSPASSARHSFNSGKCFSSHQSSPHTSTTLSHPASSLLLSKPFRCPKPNCNKSYKQANRLKYHMTNGSCNFAPPKDLEQVQALLASKRSARDSEAAGEDDNVITEGELREVECEAERRLRPFACGVADCQPERRYMNMNGLQYHYQHSGDHGTIGIGLALPVLASGLQHECLQHAHGKTSAASSRQSTPLASGQTTPMTGTSTPTYAQQYQQQMMYTSAHQQYLRAQQQQQALQMHMQISPYPAIDTPPLQR